MVITDRKDAHLPFVQRHLANPMIVIDPLEVAKSKTLSFEYSEKSSHVTFDGVVLHPKSVWFRKPGKVTGSLLSIDPRFHEYAVEAIKKHFSSLMPAFPEAFWVSDLQAIATASDKPLQVTIAQKLGFHVPDTLFTSDASAARKFIAQHDSCILKPVVPFIEKAGKDRQKTLYATKVSSNTVPDLTGLHQSPLIFQQAIDPAYDVRVTVVGDKVFAARVVHQSDTEGVRDWRLGHYEGALSIEPDERFPKDIEQKCIEHAKRLGLNFSAIDFVVDKKGTYWFLENNPNGQWAFVEQETGQPIGKALATLLETAGRA
jgi:glutathione synthase/RimK-type ligase-like ATP-grasp enzyme